MRPRAHIGPLLLAVGLWAAAAAPKSAIAQQPCRPREPEAGHDRLAADRVQAVDGQRAQRSLPARPAIEGYCSRTSVRAGDTLTVFVSTDPPAPLPRRRLPHGLLRRQGRPPRPHRSARSTARPSRPPDGPKNLIECRWEPVVRRSTIRDDWPSGVYLGKLTNARRRRPELRRLHRPRRPPGRPDLPVLRPDLAGVQPLAGVAVALRLEGRTSGTPRVGADVGFDRPYALYYNGLPSGFNPLTNGSGEFLLWEFPLAFWLEQQGYDVTYISNLDTHADPDGLLRAKGFLSVGHDEYWTQAMYDNVAPGPRCRGEPGVPLGQRRLRTGSTCGPGDGRPIALRVFRPRRRGSADEKELMGSTSYGVGLGDWICRRPDHWLFAGTGMKAGRPHPAARRLGIPRPARSRGIRPRGRRHRAGLRSSGRPQPDTHATRLRRRPRATSSSTPRRAGGACSCRRRRASRTRRTRTSAGPTPASSGSRATCSPG